MMNFKALVAWAFLVAGAAVATPAAAQQPPAPVQQSWFMQSKLATPIAVGTSSASTLLPTPGFVLWACNTGANDAYVAFGTANTVSVAVATGSWIKASTCNAYNLYPFGAQGPYTYVATIGSGGISTLYVESGTGTPPAALASSGGGSSTVAQGTAGSNALAWWVRVGDGTNGPVAVKPASTAPLATDSAFVVAINPLSLNANGRATQPLSAPVVQASEPGSDGSTTITSGGAAQNLFSGATPINGFEVCNPDAGEDVWISMSTTAAANGTGSARVAPNGGCYDSPTNMTPFGPVSAIAATTGHKITATDW